MAEVFAPFCSFRAKGKFGGVIQCQVKPYTKGPASYEKPQEFTFTLEGEYNKPTKVHDFFFPLSGLIYEKCEMDRLMKIVPARGGAPPEWERRRIDFEDWAKAQHEAFKAARALWDKLTEKQKVSWEIFGHMFQKQDLCTLALVPVTAFEIFMSLNMFIALAGFAEKLWAPVMDASLSQEAMRRGWKATYWYYKMKKASLRRAWVLYRKHKYTLKQVMSITEVWKKYKKWHDIMFELMSEADKVWKYW